MRYANHCRSARKRYSVKLLSTALMLSLLLIPAFVLGQGTNSIEPYEGRNAADLQGGIGLLAINWPEYFGADEYETIPAPYFDLVFKRRYFINDEHGVGAFLGNTDQARLGVSIAYLIGRIEDDSSDLQGLGDVEAGATLNIFAEVERHGLLYGGNIGSQISGESTGYFIELGVGKSWVFRDKLILSPGVAVDLASSEFVESYFGVTEAQSAASGIPVYEPKAGIKSAGLNLGFAFLYSRKWSVVGGVEYDRFLGDVADSPITENENQVTVVLGIAVQL